MFPTFDVPPQHAETVGARKHRKAREEETARRNSTATSQSSGSNRSVRGESTASSIKKGSGFGWFGKSKGVQEIPRIPTLKTKISEPSPSSPASVAVPAPQETPSPVVSSPVSELASQASERRPSQRSNPDLQYQHQQRFHVPPPLQSLPPPPTGALPQLPYSGSSSRGTCMSPVQYLCCDLQTIRSPKAIAEHRLLCDTCAFPPKHWRKISIVESVICTSHKPRCAPANTCGRGRKDRHGAAPTRC